MVRILTIIISFVFISGITGSESKKTICLNMIVKDESPVIERCLKSVTPLIDYWIIVDTGSTDGTQNIIIDFMKDIPGELHEEPWENFEYNRNHALNLAKNKADYILVIDADDELIYAEDFTKPDLDKDFYLFTFQNAGTNFQRTMLFKSKINCQYQGVLHEALKCPEAETFALMKGVVNYEKREGNRSQDPNKYLKDAEILENALLVEPNNARYVFYLAQSYKDARKFQLAIETYKRRITMKGWDQEVFWSMYQIALIQEYLQMDPEIFLDSYYKAYMYRSSRAESLFRLAHYYRLKEKYKESYITAKKGLALSFPNDILFVESWIYEWGLLMEYSLSTYYLGLYEEALTASKKMLQNPNLPSFVQEQVNKNLEWIYSKIDSEIN